MDRFLKNNDAELQSLVDAPPTAKFTVDECIIEMNRDVLLLGDAVWGRMVSVAGFIMKAATRCMRNELDELSFPWSVKRLCN